jgi:hypothetical protein
MYGIPGGRKSYGINMYYEDNINRINATLGTENGTKVGGETTNNDDKNSSLQLRKTNTDEYSTAYTKQCLRAEY